MLWHCQLLEKMENRKTRFLHYFFLVLDIRIGFTYLFTLLDIILHENNLDTFQSCITVTNLTLLAIQVQLTCTLIKKNLSCVMCMLVESAAVIHYSTIFPSLGSCIQNILNKAPFVIAGSPVMQLCAIPS